MTSEHTSAGGQPATDSDCTDQDRSDDHRPDELVVMYRDQKGRRRRLRFTPRSQGAGWWRYEAEWTGCRWRPVGRAVVEDVQWAAQTASVED